MKHRYSFATDANDSSGTAHGSLIGVATISGGEVQLPSNESANNAYVELPPFLIHPTNIVNGAVTFEAWMTAPPTQRAWTRLFDFGDINSGTGNGRRYVFLAPNNAVNGGQARTAVSDADPGFNGEDGFNTANLLGITNAHVTVVFNPNPARQFMGEDGFNTANLLGITN